MSQEIITATNYFTRWTEVVVLKKENETTFLNFYDDIVNRFGVPDSIISDNALAFIRFKVTDWAFEYGIYLNTSSIYYPQGNGLA